MDALEVMLRKVSYRKGLELYKKLCAGDDDRDFKRCVKILFSDDFKDMVRALVGLEAPHELPYVETCLENIIYGIMDSAARNGHKENVKYIGKVMKEYYAKELGINIRESD